MKLLLDENISRRLIPQLDPAYPGSTHAALIGLERASDLVLWEYARRNDFVLVTKDADFYEMSLLRGAPPRVIWLRVGNVTKTTIARLLLDQRAHIERALSDDEKTCVEIY